MAWTHVASNAFVQSGSINSTGANFLFAAVAFYGASSGFGNNSTASANVWARVGTVVDHLGRKTEYWYCDNPAYTGSDTGVVTSLDFFAVALSAWVRPAGTLSVSALLDAVGSSVSSLAVGPLTPAANDALILTFLAQEGSLAAPSAAPSGFTLRGGVASTGGNYGAGFASLNQTTAAAVTPTWTAAGSTNLSALLAAFTVTSAPTGPTINTQPANQSATAPATATFSVTATASGGSLTYQWQFSSNSGGSWSNVVDGTGQTSASYTTTATAVSSGNHRNGYQYRCVVTDSNGTVNSNAATLTVTNPPLSVTLNALVDESGNPRPSYTVDKVWAIRVSDNTLVATWTTQTTNGSGVLPALANAALTAVPHVFVTWDDNETPNNAGAKTYTPS